LNVRHSLTALISAGFILAVAGLAAFGFWLRAELEAPYYGARAAEAFVDIPRGTNTTEAANILVTAGILHRRLPFMIYLRYAGMGRHIQAGEYRFSKPETPKQIAQRLVRGDVYFHSVTVPEGLTAQETIELLARNGLGNRARMEQALLRTDWIQDLDPGAGNLEGYLFPDTYRFSRTADSETIINTMVREFRTRIDRILTSYQLPPGWNTSQIVILASMIEKEVKMPEEAPIVASVFVNRLEKGIPLACDATILYAMKLAGTYDGNLHRRIWQWTRLTILTSILVCPPAPYATRAQHLFAPLSTPQKPTFFTMFRGTTGRTNSPRIFSPICVR
jgi:UPF0755 protein